MARFTSPLDYVSVAAPCPSDWEQMIGNERVRFCSQCNLNVYNLSAFSKSEAEAFISNNEGRLCVRFYRRADGSILTRNCPVGLKAIRRRASRVVQAVSTAVLSFFAGIGIHALTSQPALTSEHIMGTIAVRPPVVGDLYVPPVVGARETKGELILGGVTWAASNTISGPSRGESKATRRTNKAQKESTRSDR